MSYRHMQLVIDHSATRGPDRAILLALAFRANEKTGGCWPSLTTIAHDSGVTRRTVTRRLPCIAAAGEIIITHDGESRWTNGGKQASNRYTITIEGRDTVTPPCAKVGTESPQGRDTQSPKVGTHSPKGRDRVTPEYKGNRKSEPKPNLKPVGGDDFKVKRL